jgi:hypothetical protein
MREVPPGEAMVVLLCATELFVTVRKMFVVRVMLLNMFFPFLTVGQSLAGHTFGLRPGGPLFVSSSLPGYLLSRSIVCVGSASG